MLKLAAIVDMEQEIRSENGQKCDSTDIMAVADLLWSRSNMHEVTQVLNDPLRQLDRLLKGLNDPLRQLDWVLADLRCLTHLNN